MAFRTVDLARAVENFGYSRYWIAEHHNSIGYACASPEILIGYIAASTSRLKVGAGGVMISNYSPLKVAETFKTLTSLFPGRIDLGIGRASGADPIATRALQGATGVRNDYIERIQLLLGFLHDGLDEAHEYALVEAVHLVRRKSPIFACWAQPWRRLKRRPGSACLSVLHVFSTAPAPLKHLSCTAAAFNLRSTWIRRNVA